MTFYVKPPEGRISLVQFRDFATTRLRFLLSLCCPADTKRPDLLGNYRTLTSDPIWAANSVCIQEGLAQDRASHFILQVLSCGDRELLTTVLLAESLLFYCRLRESSAESISRQLIDLKRHIWSMKERHGGCVRAIHDSTVSIVDQITAKKLIFHCFSNGGQSCEEHHVKVEYVHVLPLVAQRLVTLNQGLGHVPCHLIPVLLRLVFEQLTSSSVHLLTFSQNNVEARDSRLSSLQHELVSILRAKRPNFHSLIGNDFVTTLEVPLVVTSGAEITLKSQHVDKVSELFPPCMRNLHQLLRHRHRLRHDARIQYSLFLKEVGMPLHEAVEFWKSEYSKSPCRSRAGCCDHHWSKDVRRYEYSLRHMYGMEGSRKNYSGQRCSALQASCSSSHEGGCPFVFAGEEYLSKLLKHESVNDITWDTIRELRNEHKFNSACAEYLRTLQVDGPGGDFAKPAQFFHHAYKHNTIIFE